MPRPLPKSKKPMNAEPVDELPGDSDEELLVEYIKKAEFRAAVAGASIGKDGELSLTVKVPMEDKYLALPLTDVQSILMVFAVFVPTQVDRNKADLDKVWSGG